MNIKTSELEGAALDWAVAKAQEWDDETLLALARQYKKSWPFDNHTPSTDWSQCGPLIDRFEVSLQNNREYWHGVVHKGVNFSGMPMDQFNKLLCGGESAKVAACRAIVAAKMGDTVDVPEGL